MKDLLKITKKDASLVQPYSYPLPELLVQEKGFRAAGPNCTNPILGFDNESRDTTKFEIIPEQTRI